MKNGEKSIWSNPRHQSECIRAKSSIWMNPISDWSKPNFQPESFQIKSHWVSWRKNCIEINSDSLQYLYSSQYESLRTNPKKILYLVWWVTVENQSDLIRFNPRLQFEPCLRSEWIRLGFIRIKNLVLIGSDFFGMVPWIKSD